MVVLQNSEKQEAGSDGSQRVPTHIVWLVEDRSSKGDEQLFDTTVVRVKCAASGFETMPMLVVSVRVSSVETVQSFVESADLIFHENMVCHRSVAQSPARSEAATV